MRSFKFRFVVDLKNTNEYTNDLFLTFFYGNYY